MINCHALFNALTHAGKKEMFSIATKWEQQFNNPPDYDLTDSEKYDILTGRKIKAIKSIKDRNPGTGLRDAMEIVEHYKMYHNHQQELREQNDD